MRGAGSTRVRRGARWWLLLPALAVGVLVLVLNRWTAYTSDSVAQQSLVRTWLDVGHGTAYVPVDTWILKLPLYFGVELLPLSPAARLAIEVTALNVANFALLAPAAWWLAQSAQAARPGSGRPQPVDVVVPLLWLATLGGELGANRMQPNYRNLELGLTFLALALAARRLDLAEGRTPPGRFAAGGLALAIALALLWVDDPYFALLVGAPFVLACLAWFALRRRQVRLLEAAALVTLSLALIPPLFAGLRRLGLQAVPGGGATDLGVLAVLRRLNLLGPAVAAQLGLADSDPAGIVPGTGSPLTGPAAVLTGGLALVAIAAGLALVRHGWRHRLLLPAFLGLHWLLVVLAFLASASVREVAHGRYLILAFYDLGLTLAIALPALRARAPRLATGLVGLLLASTALNVATAVITAPVVGLHQWDRRPSYEAGPAAPPAERALQRAVAGTGLARGYAEFWSANLTLYRSGGAVSVNAVHCAYGRLVAEDWLTDTARRTASAPAGTFLVWQPSAPALFGCTPQGLAAQLGEPARTVQAGPQAEVWVYDHDIGPAIHPS